MSTTLNLNLDATMPTPEQEARSLHRVVRAMHDGHCPRCGYLGPSEFFWHEDRHECPICQFTITAAQARLALRTFREFMKANLQVFEHWRQKPEVIEQLTDL